MRQLQILRVILWGALCLLAAALILPLLLASGGWAAC